MASAREAVLGDLPGLESLLAARRRERLAFAAAVTLAALPALLVPTLALPDFPEHVLQLAIFRRAGDPVFQDLYTRHLATPYVGALLLAAPLAPLVGNEGATRAVLALALAAWPLSVRALLRTLGRDGELAILAAPLAWSWMAWMGFLPFLVSMPLVLLGGAVVWRMTEARRPGIVRPAALAVLGLATFACHAFALPLLGLLAASLALASPRPRRMLGICMALAPAFLVAAAWALRRAGEPHPRPLPLSYGYRSLRVTWFFPYLDGWFGEGRPYLFGLAAAGLLALATWSARRHDPPCPSPGRRAAAAGALTFLAAYLACPMSALDAWGLPARFLPFGGALALGAARLPRMESKRRPYQWMAAAIAIATLLHVGYGLAADSTEAQPARAIAAGMPDGAYLLVWGRFRGDRFRQPAFQHFGAYYVAQHGGRTNDSFAGYPHQVVRFRARPSESLYLADALALLPGDLCPVPPPFAESLQARAGPFWRFRVQVPAEAWRRLWQRGPIPPCQLSAELGQDSPWCHQAPSLETACRLSPVAIPGMTPELELDSGEPYLIHPAARAAPPLGQEPSRWRALREALPWHG
jgi:hypothetical protein